ncbi:hypothetical protein CPB85DRAFT_1217349, partial [Mucidula mucida]
PQPIFNDDYVKRFPEDLYCEETSPNARAQWRMYVEEAASFDGTMIGQYRDGLDVTLVFAGLFSSVVSTFLIQASQNLQADFTEMSATILFEILAVQRAIANGPAEHIPASTAMNPQNAFAPNSINVWINGFWSVSLACSLGVALAAVLVKQWLHHYMSLPSGTPGIRSHIRHFRYMGLEQWRVRVIIGMLPLIMHISLALFLAGFTTFFIPLRTSIAYAIGTITVVLCVLYLASNALPIMFPNCHIKHL